MKETTLHSVANHNYHLPLPTLEKFMQALDRRLLDHATGSQIITVEEYEIWEDFGSINHIRDVRVVEDAVIAALQDALPGWMRRDWETWVAQTSRFIRAIGGKELKA